MDANHALFLVRASQTFVVGHAEDVAAAKRKVKAKSLILPAGGRLLRSELAYELERALESQGKPVSLHEIEGTLGHLDGLTAIQSQADRRARVLD